MLAGSETRRETGKGGDGGIRTIGTERLGAVQSLDHIDQKGVTEMSKAGVEALVQKAMADENFRKQIKENPDAALAGYDLTAEERAAITSGNAAKLRELGVDERITKSVVDVLPGAKGIYTGE
jgi:RecB family endonuclease NucS